MVDYLVLAQDAIALTITRGMGFIPLAVFGYWFSYHPAYVRYHDPYVMIMLLATGLTMSLSGLISQTALVYMMPATGQVCFGIFLLVGLRFQCAFPLAWAVVILNLALAYSLSDTPSDTVVDAMRLLGGLMLLMSVAAYRIEQHTRQAYHDRLALDDLKATQEAAERRRLQWLEQLTTFLRHELKTAVNGLRTSVELIERRTDPNVSGRYIERCRQSLRSVDTLLDAATQAGSLEAAITQSRKHELDLSDLLLRRVDDYHELYPKQSFALQLSGENACILGNPDRLCQLLDNLVSNAVGYATAGTPVEIGLIKREAHFELSVRNQGPLLPDDPHNLFELFRSTRGETQRQDHVGLGLYVVKLISQWHGGEVSAQNSQEPAGAVFTVVLPSL